MSSVKSLDRDWRPVIYQGALVAIAGRDRCHVLADDLDESALRTVLAVCLFMREVVDAELAPCCGRSERDVALRLSIFAPRGRGCGRQLGTRRTQTVLSLKPVVRLPDSSRHRWFSVR